MSQKEIVDDWLEVMDYITGFLMATVPLSQININTAPKEDLMLLETIGEKTADAIIEYRTTHPFKTTRDIMKIKGIGEKTYEKIKDKICVE